MGIKRGIVAEIRITFCRCHTTAATPPLPTQQSTTTNHRTMSQAVPYAVEVSPDAALQFTITRDPPATDGADGGASRCVMTLKHPGLTNQHLAFKVCCRWFGCCVGLSSGYFLDWWRRTIHLLRLVGELVSLNDKQTKIRVSSILVRWCWLVQRLIGYISSEEVK